jgi:single-stranded-DNA-specific exonuclease
MKKAETRWVMRETDADLSLMSETLGVSKITACVMANRGIRSKNTALSFLAPSVERFRDTMQLKDAGLALERISSAVKNNEKIMIYGDYDADGIMSTVILYKTLRKLSANVEYYIPRRMEEGYGLNFGAVDKLKSRDVELIIAVDNGISGAEEIKYASELGMDTVIIDHHEPSEILPPAVAIVDPKQSGCPFPFKEMCAAGLTFKMAVQLCIFMGLPQKKDDYDEILALAAIATLCDIVDLSDENRIIVNSGLAVLNENKLINPGLGSLITMRGYLDKTIDAFMVGFVIGPCLNASGRLESAELAVELLLAETEDSEKRLKLAQELIELNDARKTLTAECVERVFSQASFAFDDFEKSDIKVLVLVDKEAHESIAGIVAGRVRETLCRPTILITQGDGAMKGSGRSIEGYNIFEALSKHRNLFTRFGGHDMACGLTLPEENIEPLREALNRECTLTPDDFCPKLYIDHILQPEEITLSLSDELTRLAPFGKGNSEPIFVTHNLYAEKIRVLDEKNTLIFTFATNTGKKLKGIAFGLNENYAAAVSATGANKAGPLSLDIAYSIETNEWNNNVEVQVRIKDFKIRQ